MLELLRERKARHVLHESSGKAHEFGAGGQDLPRGAIDEFVRVWAHAQYVIDLDMMPCRIAAKPADSPVRLSVKRSREHPVTEPLEDPPLRDPKVVSGCDLSLGLLKKEFRPAQTGVKLRDGVIRARFSEPRTQQGD